MAKIARKAELSAEGYLCVDIRILQHAYSRSRLLFALKCWITCRRLVWRGCSTVERDERGLWGDVVSAL